MACCCPHKWHVQWPPGQWRPTGNKPYSSGFPSDQTRCCPDIPVQNWWLRTSLRIPNQTQPLSTVDHWNIVNFHRRLRVRTSGIICQHRWGPTPRTDCDGKPNRKENARALSGDPVLPDGDWGANRLRNHIWSSRIRDSPRCCRTRPPASVGIQEGLGDSPHQCDSHDARNVHLVHSREVHERCR